MWLLPDKLLDLFNDRELHEESASSHDAGLEMEVIFPESFIMSCQHACPLFQRDTLSLSNLLENVESGTKCNQSLAYKTCRNVNGLWTSQQVTEWVREGNSLKFTCPCPPQPQKPLRTSCFFSVSQHIVPLLIFFWWSNVPCIECFLPTSPSRSDSNFNSLIKRFLTSPTHSNFWFFNIIEWLLSISIGT